MSIKEIVEIGKDYDREGIARLFSNGLDDDIDRSVSDFDKGRDIYYPELGEYVSVVN